MFDAPPEYFLLDREHWARIGRGRAPEGAAPAPGSLVTAAEWFDAYVPLAHVVAVHLESRAELHRRLSAAGLADVGRGALIVGLGGSVAAGKSTLAGSLAVLLAAGPGRPSVAVLSTDGFLLPNATLGARAGFKGFPDTYDHVLIARVMGELVSGVPRVEVPSYSHEVYDIAGDPQVLSQPDVVILEGVNALAAGADWCTVRIFLDAPEPMLRRWYVDRFLALIEAGRSAPTSFFAQWRTLSDADARTLAESVWEAVNLPNLEEHILATRWSADIVLHKGADHGVEAVAVRRR